MTDEQRIAYVNSQIACALIEMNAMNAENLARFLDNQSIAYREPQFLDIINKYNLHHNGVITELMGN